MRGSGRAGLCPYAGYARRRDRWLSVVDTSTSRGTTQGILLTVMWRRCWTGGGARWSVVGATLANAVHLVVAETLDERFPEECPARVEFDADGETYRSGATHPRDVVNRSLNANEVRRKVKRLCRPALDAPAIERVQSALSDRSAPIKDVISEWR